MGEQLSIADCQYFMDLGASTGYCRHQSSGATITQAHLITHVSQQHVAHHHRVWGNRKKDNYCVWNMVVHYLGGMMNGWHCLRAYLSWGCVPELILPGDCVLLCNLGAFVSHMWHFIVTKYPPLPSSNTVCMPRWFNADLKLAQRRRWWANLKSALNQRCVFTRKHIDPMSVYY